MPKTATASTEAKALVFENDEGWQIPSGPEISKFTMAKCGQMADELMKSELIPSLPNNFAKMSLTDKREALIGIVKELTGNGEEAEQEAEEDADETQGAEIKKAAAADGAKPVQTDLEESIAKKKAEAEQNPHGSPATAPTAEKTNKKAAKPKIKGKGVVSEDDPVVKFAHRIENIKSRGEIEDIIRDLMAEEGFNEFKLGGALARVQANDEWWKEAGYDTFRDYIETAIGVSYRKGIYAIEIYNKTLELEVSWDDFGGIGWTKIIKIMKVATKETLAEWVEKAKTMNTLSLEKHIEQSLQGEQSGSMPKQQSDVKTKTFKLFSDQKEIVEAALDKIKKDASTDSDASALEYMAQSFMGNATSVKSIEDVLTSTRKKDGTSEAFVEHVLPLIEKLCPDLTINVDVQPAADAA